MRIYPPLPFALPRVVPAGGDTVDGHFLPEGVSYRLFLLYLLPTPFFLLPFAFHQVAWTDQIFDVDRRLYEPLRCEHGCH